MKQLCSIINNLLNSYSGEFINDNSNDIQKSKHHLSPILIGILIDRYNAMKIYNNQNFNPRVNFFYSVHQTNKKTNVELFLFSLIDVDFNNKTIYGYYFDNSTDSWQTKLYPYPGAVYKMGVTLTKEEHRLKTFNKHMEAYNIKQINSLKSFDKWEVHKHLVKQNHIKPYLPKTVLYQSSKDLYQILREAHSVYLKPTGGRCAKKLIRINKTNEEYQCITSRGKTLYIKINDFEELIYYINHYFGNQSIIVQEAIDLLNLNNKLVDARVEVQRTAKDEIKILAIPIRVGNSNSPVTEHGESYPFTDFFKSFKGLQNEKIASLFKSIDSITCNVFDSLELHYGKCGEMGIDIGIDKNYNVWLIECNAHPRKVSLDKAYGKPMIRKSYENLLEYAYTILT